jgi:hypothetical protein
MVTQNPPWLGKPESDRLEFKSADALKHPETIVRAVVGFLNHKGGHVIVGASDQGLLEGKSDLKRESERLQSMLIETIEPRPARHVHVRVVMVSASEVLEIEIAPPKRKRPLYAERRHGLYGFWIRSGPTTRALTLSEARKYWDEDTESGVVPQRWDEPLVKRAETSIVLVLQAELNQQDGLNAEALLRVLEPNRRQKIARREMGWTIVGETVHPERRPGRKIEVGAQGKRTWLSCSLTAGTIRFEGRADFLRWRSPDAISEPVIYSFPLVEGVASFFWLLKEYADEAEPSASVHCQLGLWRPQGFRLGPHRPDSIAWQYPARWTPAHDNTSVERTADLDWSEVVENPDEISHAFIVHVYEDFGYEASAVPFWEEAARRFVFPK